jgi:hypothetical protein
MKSLLLRRDCTKTHGIREDVFGVCCVGGRKLVPWGLLVRVCALLSQTRRGFWPVCGFLALGCMRMQTFARRTRIRAKLPLRLRIRLWRTELRTPVCHTASACGGMPCRLAEGPWVLLISWNQLLRLAFLSRRELVLFVSLVGTPTEPECALCGQMRLAGQNSSSCIVTFVMSSVFMPFSGLKTRCRAVEKSASERS